MAAGMQDAEAQRTMLEIAAAYDTLARHADSLAQTAQRIDAATRTLD